MDETENAVLEDIRGELGPEPAPQLYNDLNASSFVSNGMDSQVERFLTLSTELAQILSGLSRRVKDSMDKLQILCSEIDLKREQLKTLHDIDASTVSLKQLMEDHRTQKENLQRLMADQNSLWEEEKERLIQEERAYVDELKMQREREEEEYRRAREEEHLEIRQKFEQELRAIRQKVTNRQEEREKDFNRREQILREKEQESARLIQELELFMSRLAMRSKFSGSTLAESIKNDAFSGCGSHRQGATPREPGSGDVWDSVNEMALSLGQNAESINDSFSNKHESALLKFEQKRTVAAMEP